ncbi:MAG: hypothetical protein R8K20_11860 [Gallionellaceae bacterium]
MDDVSIKAGDRIEVTSPLGSGWKGEGEVIGVENGVVVFLKFDGYDPTNPSDSVCICLLEEVRKL